MVLENLVKYQCRACSKVYKTWDGILKHKKVTSHLSIEVLEFLTESNEVTQGLLMD